MTALRGLQKLYERQGRLDQARAFEAEVRTLGGGIGRNPIR